MVDLAELQRIRRPAAWQAGDDVGDDVSAQRRIEGVVVVADRVLGIELVAMLAIYKTVGLGLERRDVGKGKFVNQPGTLQLFTNFTVPPRLSVVVPGQIDDGMLRTPRETAKSGEERLILRPRDSH